MNIATSYNRVYLVRATPSPKFLAPLGTYTQNVIRHCETKSI